MITAIVASVFGAGSALGGVLLNSHYSQRADERRTTREDERRWLNDRRHSYATYLGIVMSMLREIECLICFLPCDGSEAILEKDESFIKDNLLEYYLRWHEDLQSALEELQLLAKEKVATLAGHLSWVLMELGGFVESRRVYESFEPYLNQTYILIDLTRNAMRDELGLADPFDTFPMPEDWPRWWPEGLPAQEESN